MSAECSGDRLDAVSVVAPQDSHVCLFCPVKSGTSHECRNHCAEQDTCMLSSAAWTWALHDHTHCPFPLAAGARSNHRESRQRLCSFDAQRVRLDGCVADGDMLSVRTRVASILCKGRSATHGMQRQTGIVPPTHSGCDCSSG